jgi:ketosteroid isomerase-like protein
VEFDKQLIEALMGAMPLGDLLPDGEPATEARAAALAEIAADDLETVMVASEGGLTSEFHGRSGFEQAWADWLSPFDAYSSSLEEILEAPGDRLLVITRQRATPKGTTAAIESRAAAVLQFRDGRLARVEFHLDPAAARRAAGLVEA